MRSWLYCPGNNPKMIINAGLYGADGLVFDLEDAVPPIHKGEARILLSQAFSEGLIESKTSAVRINGYETGYWKDDLNELIPSGVRIVRIPKVESSDQIREICSEIGIIEKEQGIIEGSVSIQCIFETPLGVENAFKIGESSKRIDSYSFGAEDYCASVGITRGKELFPLDYPRSRISSAAAAFGFFAYDTVWGFLKDDEGLIADTIRGKSLGFDGKSVIHPDQIDIVNMLYTPSPDEVEFSKKIIEKLSGSDNGVIDVDGRMIDKPVILRAERVLQKDHFQKIRRT